LFDAFNKYLNLSKKKGRLLKVLILTHFLFFVIKAFLGDFYLADSYQYVNLAENIKSSFNFYSGDFRSDILFENYTKRPPMYSLFILFSSIFLKFNVGVLIIQNILSIASIFLCINIFDHYYKDLNNSKIFYLFLLTSISQFIYANYLMSEILFQFLIVLLCYTFHNIITKKHFKYLLYFQLIIVLLFLTKPVFYLFIIPNIILGFWFSKYIKFAYLASVLPLLICALYMNWNYQRTGTYDFSSIQNINLKNYNLYYFNVNKYGEEYALKINDSISQLAARENTYAKQQSIIKHASLSHIKNDLPSYTMLHIKGSIRMFIDPGRFDLYNFFQLENNNEVGFLYHLNNDGIKGAFNYFKSQPLIILIIIPIVLLMNIFKVIGFIMFWLKNYKNSTSIFWFMLFIIVYIVALTGLIGAARFIVPILPLYMLFSFLGFSKSVTYAK